MIVQLIKLMEKPGYKPFSESIFFYLKKILS